jgi:uncharacterized repeat protein (TIGR03803 family)
MNSREQLSRTRLRAVSIALALAIVLVAVVVATPSAQAQTFRTLYNFTGGSDGGLPIAGLILDAANNLYGTTGSGGTGSCKNKGLGVGCGTVFKVDKTGKETVLYSFPGTGKRGANPFAGVLRDAKGNLYGTTFNGGSTGCNKPKGCGVVFKVAKSGKETVLHSFNGGTDGAFANGILRDPKGNFYGTTGWGGSSQCNEGNGQGCGTVFELDTTGTESVLYSFTGAGGDGAIPSAGLVRDAKGNLYGTTEHGGNSGCDDGNGDGCGTVFKLDTTGKESVLYSFTGGADGANPYAGLVLDASGNLYGTTYGGGASGYGTVFKVDTKNNETVLYSFGGGTFGSNPYAGLVIDKKGNLYGTTFSGGASGYGTVFKVDKTGNETVLHSFANSDGANPGYGYLVRDTAGNLYGTTLQGGTSGTGCLGGGCGTVFKLTP